MQLMFVGDSFCSQPHHGWPNYLFRLYHPNDDSMNFLCQGIGGVSWWSVRKSILHFRNTQAKKFNDCEVVVVIHPVMHRVHSDLPGDSLGVPVILPPVYDNTQWDESVLAVSLFYKYIYSEQFFQWAYRQWLQEVESLLPTNAKIIHWFVNSTDLAGIQLRGNVVDKPLMQIQQHQFAQHLSGEQQLAAEQHYMMYNHFTHANNHVIANELQRMIDTDNFEFDIEKIQPVVWPVK